MFQVYKKIIACKFCGSTEQGEQLSSYKKRAEVQAFIVELVISQNGLINFVKKELKRIQCLNLRKQFLKDIL